MNILNQGPMAKVIHQFSIKNENKKNSREELTPHQPEDLHNYQVELREIGINESIYIELSEPASKEYLIYASISAVCFALHNYMVSYAITHRGKHIAI